MIERPKDGGGQPDATLAKSNAKRGEPGANADNPAAKNQAAP